MQETFSILTFNTGLLYAPVLGRYLGTRFLCPIGNFYKRRSEMVQEILNVGADIICLQEVGHEDDKEWFQKKLSAQYPHSRYDHRKTWIRFPNGLMIFSKFPIKKHILYQFKERPWTEWFLRKGFTITTLSVQGKDISIAHTHSTIGGMPNKPTATFTTETQRKHTERMLVVVEKVNNDIVIGDLNSGPDYRPTSYDMLIKHGYRNVFTLLDPKIPLPYTYSATYCNAQEKLFMDLKEFVFDHVLLNEKSVLVSVGAKIVLKGKGISDHLGVHATFKFV